MGDMQDLFDEDEQSNEVPQITLRGSGQPMSIVNVHHDSSATPTIVKLNGTNYLVWSQLLEPRVAGKGKYGYLTGASAAQDSGSRAFKAKQSGRQLLSTMMVPPTLVNTGVTMAARNFRPTSSYKPANSTINGLTTHSMLASTYKPEGSTTNGPTCSRRPSGLQRVKPQNARRCTHCNSMNHFVTDCFKLHGYLKWWDEVKERKKAKAAVERYAQGKVALCIGSLDPYVPQASPMPSVSSSIVPPGFAALPTGDSVTSSDTLDSAFAAVVGLGIGSGWIIDSSASNHMTFDPKNLKTCTTPSLTNIIFNKNDKPFALIHSDVWGPFPVSTVSGIRWFVTFVDDYTRMTWDNGLLHETTCPYTLQQNGVAKRKNRHILEVARSIFIEAHTPKMFWSDAIVYAVYLLNRMPSSVHGYKTPLDVLTSTHPLPSIMTLLIFTSLNTSNLNWIHNIEEQNWNWTIMLPDITIEREEVICNEKENAVTSVEDLAPPVANP
ncbi:unnamed protein product, partial [Prunus brigantina]